MSERAWLVVLGVGLSVATVAPAQAPPSAALTLRRAAELALENAPDVAAAQAAAREKEASARLVADQLRPQVWLTTTPGWGQGLPAAIAGSLPAIAGVAVRQTLYDPLTKADLLQKRADQLSTGVLSGRARQEAVRAALLAYGRCWADDAMVTAARQRQAAAERALEHAMARRAAERATDLDFEQARLRATRARMRTLDLESARDLDALELRRLTGWPADAAVLPVENPLASLPSTGGDDDLAAARAADPDLRAAGQVIEVLSQAVELESATLAPVVAAEAQYSRLARASQFLEFYRKFEPNDWSVGVSVALPLWSGGHRADAVARAEASLARASSERSSRDLALELLVRRAQSAVDQAHAQLTLSREARAVAEEALRVARARVAEGRGEPDEVETLEGQLADAQEETARWALALFTSRVELLELRGELVEAVVEVEVPAQPDLSSDLASTAGHP